MRHLLACAVFILTSLCCAAVVRGQCGEWDNRFGPPLDMNNVMLTTTTWDPDGDGPLPAQLVAGGYFFRAGGVAVNRIARWDGSTWQPFGSGMNNSVLALTTWDPDGPGPLPAELVAGGEFTVAGDVTANRIARWDGTSWHPIGTGMTGTVNALTTWDPDGDGPLPAQLVAGGSFTTADGVWLGRIARWDGSTWQPFGSGMNISVLALTTWDPDGPGPLPSQLVAGGEFTAAGGVTVNRIARWDGSMWQSLGSGMSNIVRSLTTWDPDGEGPLAEQLVAGGSFPTAGGVTVNRIARWDGSSWQPFSGGMLSHVRAVTTWDPDGEGPLPAQLVAGGSFITASGVTRNRIARWDGSTWQPFGSGMNNSVLALTTWDPDGPGPLPVELVAGGEFGIADGVTVKLIARWNGSVWQPFGSGMSSLVQAVTTWDPDGTGPLPAQLVAGGSFVIPGGVPVNRVSRWDGSAWQPFGTGTNNSVYALTTWDPDGDGPLPAQLVAGGNFNAAGGVPASHVARWDGSTWQPLGSGTVGPVITLTTWDPDGDGPQNAQLVAGGNFNFAGGVAANRIARWDGSSWQPFGSGMSSQVLALTTWDPDGDGPLPPHLVAGGAFVTAGGATVDRIARWDGSAWQPLDSGMNNLVHALTTWDPDGPGPLPAQLVAGGDFSTAGGVTVNRISRWDGSAWQAFDSGMVGGDSFNPGSVFAMTTWDPDGPGPLPEELVAGGGFTAAGGVPVNFMARWDGSAWQPFDSGVSGGDVLNLPSTRALTIWDPDGSGPQPAQLVVGGKFEQAGSLIAGYLALWSTLAPEITQQPDSESFSPGTTVILSADARNGQPIYQWRKGTLELEDGPAGSGSVISGALTQTLTITNAQSSDAGAYDVVVTNSCGQSVSDQAVLSVTPPPPCGGDANGDNMVDGADLSVLLFLFGQTITPGAAADFNGDGVIDGADLSVLLFRFGTAC